MRKIVRNIGILMFCLLLAIPMESLAAGKVSYEIYNNEVHLRTNKEFAITEEKYKILLFTEYQEDVWICIYNIEKTAEDMRNYHQSADEKNRYAHPLSDVPKAHPLSGKLYEYDGETWTESAADVMESGKFKTVEYEAALTDEAPEYISNDIYTYYLKYDTGEKWIILPLDLAGELYGFEHDLNIADNCIQLKGTGELFGEYDPEVYVVTKSDKTGIVLQPSDLVVEITEEVQSETEEVIEVVSEGSSDVETESETVLETMTENWDVQEIHEEIVSDSNNQIETAQDTGVMSVGGTAESVMKTEEEATESVMEASEATTESVIEASEEVTESEMEASEEATESVMEASEEATESETEASEEVTESEMEASEEVTEYVMETSETATESVMEISEEISEEVTEPVTEEQTQETTEETTEQSTETEKNVDSGFSIGVILLGAFLILIAVFVLSIYLIKGKRKRSKKAVIPGEADTLKHGMQDDDTLNPDKKTEQIMIAPKKTQIHGVVVNNKGRVRKNNEDNFYLNGIIMQRDKMDDGIFTSSKSNDIVQLYAVCDGMGGADCGEDASYGAVKELELRKAEHHNMFSTKRMVSVLRNISDKIYQDAEQKGKKSGTTIVMMLVAGGKVIFSNVGDSRIYRFRDRELTQISLDHSKVQRMISMGLLTPEQAKKDPSRHVITQYMGMPSEIMISPYIVTEEELHKDDVYVLCSDGLTDMVEDAQMAEILREYMKPQEAAQALMKAALHNGGRDNVTVMLLRVLKD